MFSNQSEFTDEVQAKVLGLSLPSSRRRRRCTYTRRPRPIRENFPSTEGHTILGTNASARKYTQILAQISAEIFHQLPASFQTVMSSRQPSPGQLSQNASQVGRLQFKAKQPHIGGGLAQESDNMKYMAKYKELKRKVRETELVCTPTLS